ncbi:MAG: hypothetical protein CMH60_00170 [Myxococcales bacterium]|nr:hypothetical protein [Myxococcales bacterium]|tara:strand:+ start:379 stop:1035 length:657 start_codon:yes stop_codon:yes gene_type:complete
MDCFWLSHPIGKTTPLYGGAKNIELKDVRSIARGDTSNNTHLDFPNHSGSHVDAPYHFLADGKTITDYAPTEWIYESPLYIDYEAEEGELIEFEKLSQVLVDAPQEVDFILIRTGFEAKRGEDTYWQSNPGMHPDSAQDLKSRFPGLRAIGFDFISLSSYQHREIGRTAHKEYLGRDILIYEDLSLENLDKPLTKVIALPLRIHKGDGAPCTMIGWTA